MGLIYLILYVFVATLCYRIAEKYNVLEFLAKYISNDEDEKAVLAFLCTAWPIMIPILAAIFVIRYTIKYSNKLIDRFL